MTWLNNLACVSYQDTIRLAIVVRAPVIAKALLVARVVLLLLLFSCQSSGGMLSVVLLALKGLLCARNLLTQRVHPW